MQRRPVVYLQASSLNNVLIIAAAHGDQQRRLHNENTSIGNIIHDTNTTTAQLQQKLYCSSSPFTVQNQSSAQTEIIFPITIQNWELGKSDT